MARPSHKKFRGRMENSKGKLRMIVSGVSDVVVYDIDGDGVVVNSVVFAAPPIDQVQNVMVWTEGVGPGPTHLIVSSKARLRVYLQPKLLSVNGGVLIFRAFEEQASGSGDGRVERIIEVRPTTFHNV